MLTSIKIIVIRVHGNPVMTSEVIVKSHEICFHISRDLYRAFNSYTKAQGNGWSTKVV